MTKYYESLTVPATLDSLSTIANYIKQVGAWANLSQKKVAKLRLAVDEIATNIIDYGYSNIESQNNKILELRAKLEKNQLILWIEDTGIAYNPNQQENPQDLYKPLADREIGGLGVYLARINVDQLIYERVDAQDGFSIERNRNIFIVNLE